MNDVSDLYLFSWDEVPGNDSGRLIDFLKQNYCIDWVNTAKIEKIDDGKTIRIYVGKNYLTLSLNNGKTKVNLKIDDGRTDEFIVSTRNGKLNIYSDLTPDMLFEEFRKAQKDIDFGKNALNKFSSIEDKLTFLEPTIQFLSQEEQDQIRSWGTNILEMIGGERAFSFLIDLLREADSYLFSWNEIPGNDSGRLIDFLKQNLGIDWAQTAKIEKIDDGKTIRVSTEENFLSLKLNNEKTKINIEIDDGITYEFIAKTEDGKLNIYATSKETKREYRHTRFFALRAIARLASSDREHEELHTLIEQVWEDEDEDYLIRAEASILLAQQGRSEPLSKLSEMLSKFKEEDYWAPVRALRALREFPLPNLADEIITVMRDSGYLDHRHDAIEVLGAYTDNTRVVRALGDVVITDRNRYLRLAAIESLAKLKDLASQADLVHAIHDEDAEIREQASNALKSLLSKEGAVISIVQHTLGEQIGEEDLTRMTDAIRRIDPDRTFSTEILSKESSSEDRTRADLAKRILIDLGGWAAVQKLSQRRSTLDALDDLLAKSEEVVKSNFEETIRHARHNFYFAMGVNILIVATGLILISLAINQFIQQPEKLETWILPGGAGALGVLINLVFNNPRKNAREDLVALMDVNVIFLGFLRQLNEIDATFKHAYIESRDFGPSQMRETVQEIDKTVAQTLNKAYHHLRQQPSETSESKEAP